MKFNEININEKLKDKTSELGFKEPTLIQEKCIPEIIKGKDVVGQAETGSGKTVAFCLPLLDKITSGEGIQTVVLTPTRELCVQVTDVFKEFGRTLKIKTTSIYGGVSILPQIKRIRRSEVIVGTPGRMLDHLRRKTMDLGEIRFLVLDETDKMLEMGFIDDVEKIINYMPKQRQTLMFSATIERSIHRLMNKHLSNPIVIKTKSQVDKSKLHQIYYDIYQHNDKFSILVHLVKSNKDGLAIVFCATRRECDVVEKNLRVHGIKASAIHGGMNQNKRMKSLDALKEQKTDVLVATDVAARGLDIKNVSHIYNYDVPKTSIEYIHRIGRTARAGENGAAITLLTGSDHENFRRVQSNKELDIEKADIPKFKKVSFSRKMDQEKKPSKNKHWNNNQSNNYNRNYRHGHKTSNNNNRNYRHGHKTSNNNNRNYRHRN
ncbi:DNA/RNA helicase, superfamily II [Thermoplasmatales archaeon SCGC AB-539-C06]|nr:DNA/RNA helicase, superfamily II [Thermoplasmatales archaeon SCGC AB-539-C06]